MSLGGDGDAAWVGVTDIYFCPNPQCHKLLLKASQATLEGYIEGKCLHCHEYYVLNPTPNPKQYAVAFATKSRAVYRDYRERAKRAVQEKGR